MVAVINTGHSLRSIFYYNENKVSAGTALCIAEGNYPVDIDKMTPSFKMNLFLKQLELNENVTRNSVHISLNFDPSETALSKEKLVEIAHTYMQKIGFGTQPYLVYQHHDAGHPHIHIVSIKVKADGKRIDMQNIGRNQSETARKEIESAFNLVRAQSKKNNTNLNILPPNIHKIQYGVSDSKRAVSSVLNFVIPNYKFTTIGELNAVLNLYNITAEQGRENSKMFLNKGLVYRILDDNKKPVGVPIKASSFYLKPTLKNLELKFAHNKTERIPHIKRIKNTIDLALFRSNNIDLKDLENILLKEGIATVYRKNADGLLYGITYVDHTTKCSCNGSAIGPGYSAKAIQERCAGNTMAIGKVYKKSDAVFAHSKQSYAFISESELQKIIDTVLQPENTGNYVPNQLKGRRKKRKRKGPSDN